MKSILKIILMIVLGAVIVFVCIAVLNMIGKGYEIETILKGASFFVIIITFLVGAIVALEKSAKK